MLLWSDSGLEPTSWRVEGMMDRLFRGAIPSPLSGMSSRRCWSLTLLPDHVRIRRGLFPAQSPGCLLPETPDHPIEHLSHTYLEVPHLFN